jgi:hypothetical protein
MKRKLANQGWIRFCALVAVTFTTAQCGFETPLELSIGQNTTNIFYGDVNEACGGTLSEEKTGPGVKYCNICVRWKQSGFLQISSLKVTFPPSQDFAQGVNCNFDGDELENVFADGTTRPGTTSPPYYDGRLQGTGNNQSCALGLVCTGITATNPKSQFVATGTATVRGVNETTGRSFSATTKVILNYFPE